MNVKQTKPKNIVVLVSGNGSNLQAIIDSLEGKVELGSVIAVISNNASAFGLERAKKHSIDAIFINPKDFNSRERFDQKLAEEIESYNPALVVLAGFMRILSADFVKVFSGRLINIHPSLLPKYPGLYTHARVIENRDLKHGTSVHFVTEELDGGPLIAQAELNLVENESSKQLALRVQLLEYKLYPWVIELFLQGKITQFENGVKYNNNSLVFPLILNG
ncbi:MAG: phosphoribosylglycinamide formyltransferase [Gammaproteobacteria bacterium]|nr:MAG: phosphoribosylglycinamide formyltransferase [Gammaproteobacteria bacterium]